MLLKAAAKKRFHQAHTAKREIILLLLTAIALLIVIYTSLDLGRNNESIIQQQLSERGYAVSNISFTQLDEIKWRFIYQSSEPLVLSNGELCDRWEIIHYGLSGRLRLVYPYPSGSWLRDNLAN